MTKTEQVFISYATEDTQFAHHLADDLQRLGIQVWIAPDSIKPGESWVDAIERGLEESSHMVVVLTPAALESEWVRKETDVAIARERKGHIQVIPLDVEPCEPPLLLSSYHMVSFRRDYDAGLSQLANILGMEAQAVLLPQSPQKDRLRLGQPWSYDFYEHYASVIPHNMQEHERHKQARCGSQFKKALWAHPPREGDGYYLYQVPIPKNVQRAQLRFYIGIRDGADMTPENNVVRFKIYVDDRLEFDKPFRDFYWQLCSVYVDVPPGDECEVKFVTNAMGEDRGNWAVWGEPVLEAVK